MPFVYMLRCRDASLYTGSAKDLARRLAQHQSGRASRYTRARLPVTLAWSRRVRSWSRALREERRIKALTRARKEALLGAAAPRSARRLSLGAGQRMLAARNFAIVAAASQAPGSGGERLHRRPGDAAARPARGRGDTALRGDR